MAYIAKGAANRSPIAKLQFPDRLGDRGEVFVEEAREGQRVVLRVPVTHVHPTKKEK